MTGPDAAPASPAAAPPDRRALAAGAVVGAAAVAVELVIGDGGAAARAIAALGVGLVGGVAGWLVADALADRARRRAAEVEVRANPGTGWAAPTVVPAPGWTVPTRPVPANWTDDLQHQALLRYVAAGAAAVIGAVAALARLTPTRAAVDDALVVGYPAVIGAAVTVAGSAATYRRVVGWLAVFGAWSRRVVPAGAVPEKSDDQTEADRADDDGFTPQQTQPVIQREGPLPLPPPPPLPFNVKLPDTPDNV